MAATDFFSEQDLSFEHVKALVAGMLAVARVDGIHDRELTLIREFYQRSARTGDPSLEELASQSFDAARTKDLFGTPDSARLFVKSLILLAFADGTYAAAEDALIRKYAADLGLTGRDVDNLHEATKEYLLASLSHIQNVEALKPVLKKLELG